MWSLLFIHRARNCSLLLCLLFHPNQLFFERRLHGTAFIGVLSILSLHAQANPSQHNQPPLGVFSTVATTNEKEKSTVRRRKCPSPGVTQPPSTPRAPLGWRVTVCSHDGAEGGQRRHQAEAAAAVGYDYAEQNHDEDAGARSTNAERVFTDELHRDAKLLPPSTSLMKCSIKCLNQDSKPTVLCCSAELLPLAAASPTICWVRCPVKLLGFSEDSDYFNDHYVDYVEDDYG